MFITKRLKLEVGVVTHDSVSSIVIVKGQPKSLQTDQGMEFLNRELQVFKKTRHPTFHDTQRRDQGLHRRTIQSYSENAHLEVIHGKPDLEVSKRVAASPASVQQLSQKYRNGTS